MLAKKKNSYTCTSSSEKMSMSSITSTHIIRAGHHGHQHLRQVNQVIIHQHRFGGGYKRHGHHYVQL